MDIKKWNELPNSSAVQGWPYTNLHDLNLDWIINTTKEFAAEISRFEDNVTEEVTGFEGSVTVKIGEFEGTIQEYTERMDTALATVDEKIEYIDNFFSSLDVQQEINNKLNSMAGDGSLAALLKPFADAYMQQDAPGIISAWLAAHITEPVGVVIDSSLSVAGAAADAKVTGDNFKISVGLKTVNAADYSNRLSNIRDSAIFAVTATDWQDMPTGISAGTCITSRYQANFANQFIIAYPSLRFFVRSVNTLNGTILRDWSELASASSVSQMLGLISPIPASYDNLLSKINIPGFFTIERGQDWTDKPDVSGALLVNYVYSATAAMQISYEIGTGHTFMRYVNPSTGDYYQRNWMRIDGVDGAHSGTIAPADYENELAKVTVSVNTAFAGAGDWTDFPEGERVGYFSNVKFPTAYIQTFITYPANLIYVRTTNGIRALTPWIPVSGGNNNVVYYAIGDSITSGSYSTDDGQGVVARNAEWSYPNTIARRYGCKVHNIAVPGKKITEFSEQAALIGADANIITITGGANDYISSDSVLGDRNSPVGYETVCGALKAVIQAAANTAPNARIVLISPMLIKSGSLSSKWSLNQVGAGAFSYAQLSDAMKNIAEDYNIEFIDGTRTGPVNILNIGNVLKDNIHPTKAFYSSVANWIGSKIF